MKKLISLVLLLVLFCSIIPFAYADCSTAPAQMTEPAADDGEISPRAEQTEWFFRNNNGVMEKRLWSYTYGKWLTDWIPAWD